MVKTTSLSVALVCLLFCLAQAQCARAGTVLLRATLEHADELPDWPKSEVYYDGPLVWHFAVSRVLAGGTRRRHVQLTAGSGGIPKPGVPYFILAREMGSTFKVIWWSQGLEGLCIDKNISDAYLSGSALDRAKSEYPCTQPGRP
jgi:hypothetical protein